MKSKFLYILFFLIVTSSTLIAQSTTPKGYTIEGDQIVFTFNTNDYEYLSNDIYEDHLEISEVYIKTVAVAGAFNDWSRDAWPMKRLHDSIYELRKNVADFGDDLDWEFKFVINRNYWAEPNSDDYNIVPAKTKEGKPLHVYNLRLFTAFPLEKGNATFKLKGFKDAREVILSGTFNRWNEDIFKMNKTEDGWELTLQLKPDRYFYRFIVDGNWMEDPDNLDKVPNEYDEYNSAISIEVNTIFYLEGFENAETVILAGTFNDWNEEHDLMQKTDRGWKFTTYLSGGKHHYKFIVDGKWMTDPNNPVREYDGKGNINSVIMVN